MKIFDFSAPSDLSGVSPGAGRRDGVPQTQVLCTVLYCTVLYCTTGSSSSTGATPTQSGPSYLPREHIQNVTQENIKIE